jgi:hypothetical protein
MTTVLDRRQCLILGSTVVASSLLSPVFGRREKTICSGPYPLCSGFGPSPTHSIIPIVGDGKWIWREPPKDATGHLEPRDYEVRVGIEATGVMESRDFIATTVAPSSYPEQEILEHRFEATGCETTLQELTAEARQLVVAARQIAPDQTVSGQVVFKVRVTKSFFNYQREQFAAQQTIPRDDARAWLGDSPGIETKLAALGKIIEGLGLGEASAWDKARAYHQWVFENIRGVPGPYTSVRRALETGRGDCEERAGVFVALCRASGIPARLVWVPNHAWAEFLLFDEFDRPHWIPAHTAAYSWFGWTGAHEIVLQKGDRIHQRGLNKNVRLVKDWWRGGGAKPKIRFTASVRPLGDPSDPNGDPGPGAREKLPDGKWVLAGKHPEDKHMRE